ncbi:hypothetical protein [Hoeflea ulvae]|uniref:Uncharacterized protein n=1 Tax=Hoeflea ulvae TaxID=2983764 RepID=A0ABT3YM32_9HYPH|nr:hypothetical protein [Hoeflea ulvae]MCY0096936.1 hypothetical protein [Hoeflea ulvae]
MQPADKHTPDERREGRLPEPESNHEHNKAAPESADLSDPAEVWKDGESTPTGGSGRRSGGDRVAGPGDTGSGAPAPYPDEIQADAISRQTKRKSDDR